MLNRPLLVASAEPAQLQRERTAPDMFKGVRRKKMATVSASLLAQLSPSLIGSTLDDNKLVPISDRKRFVLFAIVKNFQNRAGLKYHFKATARRCLGL